MVCGSELGFRLKNDQNDYGGHLSICYDVGVLVGSLAEPVITIYSTIFTFNSLPAIS